MILKHRKESAELQCFRQLFVRGGLTPKEETYYQNLEKGFEGELSFDEWFKCYHDDLIILNDLTFEVNNTHMQIDSLFISSEKIFFFEVKNYDGDFYIDSGRWYSTSKKEIKNPILQLERTESLLRQLFQYHQIKYRIEPYLIFVNPRFFLYNAPIGLPIIFPNQRERFVNKIASQKLKLNTRSLATGRKLLTLHTDQTPFNNLTKVNLNKINKGIYCQSCKSIFSDQKGKTLLICNHCGDKEGIEPAILRSIDEFVSLFPERKITTNEIYDWCKIIRSKRFLQQILTKHFKLIKIGKASYYVKK